MGGGRPLLEGWLTKSPPPSGPGLKRWHKRWVVLFQSKILEYYEDKKKSKPKGSVNLEECIAIRTGLTTHKNRGKHMFCVETPSRYYYFCAASKEEEVEWVAKMNELCDFPPVEASAGFHTMGGKPPKAASTGALVNGSMTLPSGGKQRAHTIDALSSPVSSNGAAPGAASMSPEPRASPSAAAGGRRATSAAVLTSIPPASAVFSTHPEEDETTPRSDYFMVGEATDVTAAPLRPQPVENGVTAVNHLGQRIHSMHLGRPMTEQEMQALDSYDMVHPGGGIGGGAVSPEQQQQRRGTRGGSLHAATRQLSAPAELAQRVMSSPPDERYVDLPTAQSAAIAMAMPSTAALTSSPYQIPPPPRALNPSSSAPASGTQQIRAMPSDPEGAYSFPPAPRPASSVSPEQQQFQQQQQVPRLGGYATLGPDDMKAPPPTVDRGSKPRQSIDSLDPDAPLIDRGSKPLHRSLNSMQSLDMDCLDGQEFEHVPIPTAGSKRFSKLGYYDYDIPPSAVPAGYPSTMPAGYPLQVVATGALPVMDHRFSQNDPMSNYDVPPNFRPVVASSQVQVQPLPGHALPPEQQAMLMGQLSSLPFPLDPQLMAAAQRQQQQQAQMYNFDELQQAPYTPDPRQNYDYPPGSTQHRLTTMNPTSCYDHPPNHQPVGVGSGGGGGQPLPPPSSLYDYPPPGRAGSMRASTINVVRMPTSPPEGNYNHPPRHTPGHPMPTSNYSYLPPPIRAVSPDTAYSIPPAPMPARPGKPGALPPKPGAEAVAPFNPHDYIQAAAQADQEYMLMGGGGGGGPVEVDDQYTDMSKLNAGPSVGDQVLATMRGEPPPPRPPKP